MRMCGFFFFFCLFWFYSNLVKYAKRFESLMCLQRDLKLFKLVLENNQQDDERVFIYINK